MRRSKRIAAAIGCIVLVLVIGALGVRTLDRWNTYRDRKAAAPGVFLPVVHVAPVEVPADATTVSLGVISFRTTAPVTAVHIDQALGTTDASSRRVTVMLGDARVWVMLPYRTDVSQTIDGEVIDASMSLDFDERLAQLEWLRNMSALSLVFGSSSQFDRWKDTMAGEGVMSGGGYASVETDAVRAIFAAQHGAQAMVWSPDGRSGCVIAVIALNGSATPRDLLIEVLSTLRFEIDPLPEDIDTSLALLVAAAHAHAAFTPGQAPDLVAPTQSPSPR